MHSKLDNLRIISGSSNPTLAQNIANYIGIKLSRTILGKFADGQLRTQILDNVRGCYCVIIQTSADTHLGTQNDFFLETCLLADALKRSGAKNITVVYAFYPYARSDKKDDGRVSIGASLCTNLLVTAGVSRFIAIDLHAGQIQGFTNSPFDNLYGMKSLMAHFVKHNFARLTPEEIKAKYVLVSPDQGGAKRARAWSEALGVNSAVMDKHRDYSKPGTVTESDLIGNVENKICIVVDDMIDTGGTLVSACVELKKYGAVGVHIIVTHGVFSKKILQDGNILDPIDLINANQDIDSITVTNTIDQSTRISRCQKLHVVDVGALIGEAIKRHRTGESVSELFNDK